MDLRELLSIACAVFTFAAIFPYIRDILRRRTKPDVVTWFGWSLLTGIGSAAQLAKGASLSIVVPLYSTIGSLTIALLGLRYGHARFTRLDVACIGLGALAIVLWILTKEPLVALFLSVLADLIVAMPTLVKTYRSPKTETPSAYFLFAVAALLGLLATDRWDTQNVLYPVYLVAFNLSETLLALRGKFGKYKVIP